VTLNHTLAGASCNASVPGPEASCAHITALALPQAMSVLSTAINNASRIEFHACDWSFVDAPIGCREDFAPGQIGSVSATVHTVQGSPAALPVLPVPTKAQFVQLESYERDNNTTDTARHDTNLLV